MIVHYATLHRPTTEGTDLLDVTDEVQQLVRRAGVSDGIVVVGVAGSTASVTTIEYESGVLKDLRAAIERIAPLSMRYAHDERWGDGNGHAHVRAALLGPSATFPIRGGNVVLGTWQQIVLCDFDNRPRNREVYVQVLGT
jgi:secondary thiamine-phosphate synthase enzyme